MTFVVRPGRPGDWETVAEFNRLLAWETEGKSLDPQVLGPGVRALLADANKGWYFVAEQEGKLVGQIAVTFEWSDWRNGWFWWIQSVYVAQEVRRQGVFRGLFQEVEKAARKAGDVVGLRLYVEGENHAAQETYRRLGWKEAGYRVLENLLGPSPLAP